MSAGEGTTVRAGDLDVHVERAGRGSPVVLLHGFPETSWEWRHVMPALARDHHVIAPDLRGFGGTGRPFPPPVSRELLARDLELLLDALGLGAVSLVGHDWGGLVAHAFAVRHSGRIDRLALVDTTLTKVIPRTAPHIFWMQVHGRAETVLEADGPGFVRVAIPSLCRTPDAFDEATIERYASPFADPSTVRLAISYYRDALRPSRRRPDGAFEPIAVDEMRAALDAGIGRHPLWDEVVDVAPDEPRPRLSMPTAWIHATALGRPNRAFRAQFEEAFTDLRVFGIDCGHWIPEERPDELAAMLLDVLGCADEEAKGV